MLLAHAPRASAVLSGCGRQCYILAASDEGSC